MMSVCKHYLFPNRYVYQFLSIGGANSQSISLEDFTIAVDTDEIPTFPDYETFNAAWEGAWAAFFEKHSGKPISQKQVFAYCQELTKLFGLNS
jgi:hypothetical protein